MTRILFLLAILLAALAGTPAHAEAADIDAAARGVVRVVIFDKAVEETGEEQLYPVSHGTGFAVSPQRIS